MQEHIDSRHGVEHLDCKPCEYTFDHSEKLLEHQIEKHEQRSKEEESRNEPADELQSCVECNLKDKEILEPKSNVETIKEEHTENTNDWKKRRHDLLSEWEYSKKEIEAEMKDLKE